MSFFKAINFMLENMGAQNDMLWGNYAGDTYNTLGDNMPMFGRIYISMRVSFVLGNGVHYRRNLVECYTHTLR